MRKLPAILIALVTLAPQHGFACLWDYDTLAMERQQFPAAQELIAGQFVRHSDAYYRWRIADRGSKLVADWTPSDFDDVAVAYDKLGQHDEAIATIQAKIDRWPDEWRYESEANLGTFLIHAGRLAEGLPHLDKAIAINPDAHFGREIYQKLLVEYVLEQRAAGAQLPLDNSDNLYGSGFAKFVGTRSASNDPSRQATSHDAVTGILGMMRFGKHDSPILLETLGDLMRVDDQMSGAKMLAARAYLKASYAVDDPVVATAYREKAQRTLELQVKRDLPEIEAELKREIQQADAFFQQIAADEKSWIAAGTNLDDEFAKKYYDAPVLALDSPNWHPMTPGTRAAWLLFGVFSILVIVVATGLALVYRWAPRRRDSE